MTVSNDLSTIIYNNLVSNNNSLNVQASDISGWIDSYLAGLTSNYTPLSQVNPDFEQILLQLMQTLGNDSAWMDILTSGTGQAILRYIASMGTMVSFAQERGVQESMLGSARLTSSIYAATNMLGARIVRKTPANVSVSLTYSSNSFLEIPPYTQFTIGGISFFNRNSIIFNIGSTAAVPAILYQGDILVDNYTSNGQDWFTIEIGQNDYTVSDTDVVVVVDTTLYTRVTDGLYKYKSTDNVWNDKTTPEGNVEIQFGNGEYGFEPSVNSNIQVTYVRTLGDTANYAVSSQNVSCGDFAGVIGTTTSTVANGIAQKDREFYRINAPYMSSSKGRAVTLPDYETQSLLFNGFTIYDVLCQGQQTLGPTTTAYLNVVQFTLLTETPMTTAQWNSFNNYITNIGVAQIVPVRADPTSVPINITVNVYAFSGVDLGSLQSTIIANLQSSFTPTRYWLGRTLAESDISSYIKGDSVTSAMIDYFDIITPTSDTPIGPIQYASLGTIIINVNYTTRSYPARLT